MTRLYLSGPMTGRPDFNRAEFERVGAWLRDHLGYEVSDPVSEDIRVYGSWEEAIKRDWREHLARDISLVPECSAGIVLMAGWQGSSGANLELHVARAFKLPVWFVDERTDGLRLVPVDADWLDRFVGPIVDPPPIEATEFSRAVTDPYDGDRFVPYEENPLRHEFTTGGIKDNRGKAPINLLPSEPLVATAEVLEFGARKYKPHNWMRGLPWPDTFDSLMRHLLAWNAGEDLDPESGKSHLSHAQCQLLFLHWYTITGKGAETDNRYSRAEPVAPADEPTVDVLGRLIEAIDTSGHGTVHSITEGA